MTLSYIKAREHLDQREGRNQLPFNPSYFTRRCLFHVVEHVHAEFFVLMISVLPRLVMSMALPQAFAMATASVNARTACPP